MAKRTDKIDKQIEKAWYSLASGVQVNIMDIPRIFREVRAAVEGGANLEAAVTIVVAQFRRN